MSGRHSQNPTEIIYYCSGLEVLRLLGSCWASSTDDLWVNELLAQMTIASRRYPIHISPPALRHIGQFFVLSSPLFKNIDDAPARFSCFITARLSRLACYSPTSHLFTAFPPAPNPMRESNCFDSAIGGFYSNWSQTFNWKHWIAPLRFVSPQYD